MSIIQNNYLMDAADNVYKVFKDSVVKQLGLVLDDSQFVVLSPNDSYTQYFRKYNNKDIPLPILFFQINVLQPNSDVLNNFYRRPIQSQFFSLDQHLYNQPLTTTSNENKTYGISVTYIPVDYEMTITFISETFKDKSLFESLLFSWLNKEFPMKFSLMKDLRKLNINIKELKEYPESIDYSVYVYLSINQYDNSLQQDTSLDIPEDFKYNTSTYKISGSTLSIYNLRVDPVIKMINPTITLEENI